MQSDFYSLKGYPAAKKIAVFDTWHAPPHSETALEITQRILDDEKSVDFYDISAHLTANEELKVPSRQRVFRADNAIDRGFSLLRANKNTSLLRKMPVHIQRIECLDFQDITCIDQVKSLAIEEYRVGMSALSSLSYLLRTTDFDFTKVWHLLVELIRSGAEVYQYCSDTFLSNQYDAVVNFNGRFVNAAAISAASDKHGIPVYLHERGPTDSSFKLTDFWPHDLRSTRDAISKFWLRQMSVSCPSEMSDHARDILDSRIAGTSRGRMNRFVSQKIESNAAGSLDRFHLYLHSTEDEYYFVSKVRQPEWGVRQFDAVREVAARVPVGETLVVKLHPRYLELDIRQRKLWGELDEDSRILVLAPNQANVYDLIKRAIKVYTFGSSAGVEAVYLGKMVVTLFDSFYADCPSIRNAFSTKCLDKLVEAEWEVDPGNALPYFYAFENMAYKYKYFAAANAFGGSFCGVNLFEGYQL